MRATVKGSRLATRLDLDLEEPLVPCIVARGEKVRSRSGDSPTRVPWPATFAVMGLNISPNGFLPGSWVC